MGIFPKEGWKWKIFETTTQLEILWHFFQGLWPHHWVSPPDSPLLFGVSFSAWHASTLHWDVDGFWTKVIPNHQNGSWWIFEQILMDFDGFWIDFDGFQPSLVKICCKQPGTEMSKLPFEPARSCQPSVISYAHGTAAMRYHWASQGKPEPKQLGASTTGVNVHMYTFSRSMPLKRRCQNTKSLQNVLDFTGWKLLKHISSHWYWKSFQLIGPIHPNSQLQGCTCFFHIFPLLPSVHQLPWAGYGASVRHKIWSHWGVPRFFLRLRHRNISQKTTLRGTPRRAEKHGRDFFKQKKTLEFSSGVCNSNRFQQLLMQNAIRMITYLPAFTFFQTRPTSCWARPV